ncbi:CREG2 protein, partial [Rynchops niger]|nr:CREG2 protein [Rynchops niger]
AWWCWLLWGGAGGYVVVSSVSWPLPEGGAAADELHSSSTEDTLPSLLEEAGGLWKQSYPAPAYREDAGRCGGPAPPPPSLPPRCPRPAAVTREPLTSTENPTPPRAVAGSGVVVRPAGVGGHPMRGEKMLLCNQLLIWILQIQGMPYGNCLLLSDGPVNNSTGIPFFYVTPKDNTVADLLKNPVASLTLPEADGNFCRKNVIDPEDPRCARLTLTGQMVTVPPEEVEFAKQAMFSRHPVVRKWPRSYEWFFMKMNIEHIWLQSW